jgi:hypothetical protein
MAEYELQTLKFFAQKAKTAMQKSGKVQLPRDMRRFLCGENQMFDLGAKKQPIVHRL